MSSSQGFGASGARLLSPLIALIGVAIVVRTLTAGGAVSSVGVLLGAVFIAIGIGRFYLARRSAGRGR